MRSGWKGGEDVDAIVVAGVRSSSTFCEGTSRDTLESGWADFWR